MKPNPEDINLVVTNGYNGKTIVYQDFFKFSFPSQKEMLAEVVLPMLEEFKNVYISIGYKNT